MDIDITSNLKSFNRKERFYLVGQMLENPEFCMNDKQLDKISDLIDIKIPREYFSAFDYHLDWIYASLFFTQENDERPFPGNFIDNEQKVDLQISGTQEDVDFLLAFVDHEKTWPSVRPHFLICSPKEPQNISIEEPAYFIFNKNQSLLGFHSRWAMAKTK